jgi:hypothetical protein
MLYAQREYLALPAINQYWRSCGMEHPAPSVATRASRASTKTYGTAADVSHPDLVAFHAYWNAKRGSRPWPARGDLNPRDLNRALKRIHLYDVVQDGADFHIRVTGSAMFLGYYPDPTGKLVSEHPEVSLRTPFRSVLTCVLETSAPVYDHACPTTDRHLTKREAFSLWLPLGHDKIEQIVAQSVIVRLGY